jgi:hypothetical protein
LSRLLGSTVLLLALLPGSALGQLRPLPPLDWELFADARLATARIGGAVLLEQRASLAGTEGQLLELGDFALALRSGRMAVEFSGTMVRIFDDEEVFAEPWGGARSSEGARRRDAGDFRIATMIRLTPPQQQAAAALRFGTRLPTTDNEVGLERDRTDFFALLGGRIDRGPISLSGEAGVGINGTHDPQFEQSDVLMYSASAVYTRGPFSPRVSLVGHMDGMAGLAIRGNEELSELRIGARVGNGVWGEAEVVYGLQPFSPRTGLLLYLGASY